MACNCNTPNVNQTFIIEQVEGTPVLSACTSLFTDMVKSCSGDTTITMGTGVVTFNSNVNGINSFTANTIEANTYLSGGTNILDIVNGNDTFVTGGTFNDVSDTLTLVRNDGASVVIGGLANYYVTGGTYNNNTGLITFDRNDTLSAFTVDLSTIDVNDTFVTGGTLVNTDLILNLNDGSSTSSIDLSGLEFTGNTSGTCISDIHVSNIHSCSPLRINPNDEGNVYFGSTSGVTIDVLNQRVGIGTNTPDVELHVKGSASILRLETTQSQNSNFVEFHDPLERKGWIGYPGSTSSTDALFIRNEEDNADIIISTTDSGGTSSTAISVDGNQNVELPNGNLDISGTLTIGTLGTGTSINNLGIDSIGNVVVGTTGDTDTNTFVTGGTLSTNDLILEKNNGVDVNPINLSGLVSGKTDLTLFNSHTGDTNNPHQTSFSGLTSTAHTHTLSEITDFNTYSGSVQTQIDGKTDNTDFISHTGDTSIHFTKGDISLSEIGNSAHTHTLSEITDFNTYSGSVQTQLDGKVETILFNSHTGDTNNPHDTSFSNLTSTAHTHTISDVINLQTELDGKLNVSEFNTYSGDVQTQIDDKLETSIFNSYTGSVVDVFVSSGNANSVTQQLSFTNTTGGTFNVTNSAALFSDNDVNVTGGTYNPSNGCVTFVTNSGTTFDVCGFVTGITDTFVTGGTLSGTDLILERSSGVDVSGIDLSSLVSGKLDITVFNTYTGDTETILNSKTDNTDFTSHTGDTTIHYTKSSINLSDLGNSAHTHSITDVINLQTELDDKTDNIDFTLHTGDTSNPHQTSFSGLTSTAHTHTISQVVNLQTELDSKTDNTDFTSHTGDTTIHYTKGSINLSDLGSSAHTHTLSEITDFNSYSGNVQTQLNTKIDNGVNSGGANEVFSGKSGTDLYFRTISGGSNTTITTVGGIIKIDSTSSGDNTFVTGGTYSSGTLTLDRNDGDTVTVTGFTTGGGDNFYVTGFTYNDANTLTISQNGGLGDLTSTINNVTGLTVNGTLVVDTISATTINGSVSGLTLNDLDDVISNIPTTPDNTYQGRLLYFDVTDNQWVTGEEYVSTGNVTIWAKKGTAGTIDKGCPVYITGFDNDIHEVELANATTASTMPVIGFTGEDFDNAGVYPLITFGKLVGVDTTSTVSTINPNGETWAVNDVLYMNTTDGGLTKFRPPGTNTQIQRIAKVLKVDSNSGQLFIFNTARTAGLPNLTTDYLWLGNGNDTPQEVIRTDVGITTTGFTYNDNNTFTITDDNGGSFSSTINQMSGLTINGDLDVTTITDLSYIDFNTTATTTHQEGRVRWDGDVKTLLVDTNQQISIQVGQQMYLRGVNKTGSQLDKGLMVVIDGVQGNRPTLDLATNSDGYVYSKTIGIMSEDTSNNQEGYVITNGIIHDVDTSPYSAGTELFLSTGGTITDVTPISPDRFVRIGQVVVSHATEGSIYIRIINGFQLSELHDVKISGVTNGDLITYDSTDDIWINSKTLTGDYTINGDLDVTGDTTLNTLTATSITSNSAINVFNGHINLRDNSYFLQGRTVADANVSLIGVDNQDRVFVGNAGYDTYIDSDTIVDGSLTATTLNITTIGTGTLVNNLGVDVNGNVVSGNTNTGIYGGDGTIPLNTTASVNGDLTFQGLDEDTRIILKDGNNGGEVHLFSDGSAGQSALEFYDPGGATLTSKIQNAGGDTRYISNNRDLLFTTNTGVTTEGLFIEAGTGNMGIGTTTPQVELHVKGDSSILRLETTSLTNNNYIEFWDPTERKGFLGYVSTANIDALFIRNEEHDADIIISTTNSGGTSLTAINIDGNQDVGIPNGNLDVSGTLNITTIGGGTPVGNLGFDSNGQVVTGTTGGGTGVSDANKLFSWFMNVT